MGRIEKILSTPVVRALLRQWEEREGRPRVACPDCQFEYVEEEGHECEPKGEGKGRHRPGGCGQNPPRP